RGVDSHGVHLLPEYANHFRNGNIRPEADGHVVSESGACLLYDGEHGIGQWISYLCCQHAVRLARAHGLGMVVARNSNHFGAAAYWGQQIAAHRMIGIVMCNASPSVPPWQGREGRIGTNPICVAAPSTGEGAWLLDMATTTVAMNKIRRAYNDGLRTIPYGWAMDRDGVPTTSAEEAI
ncbi:MAG: Ldh family oxidoreductase, partial [Chloroflexi bacterium]|nr:Ldh family oxidoreductase [Chloroflexota bacterium]